MSLRLACNGRVFDLTLLEPKEHAGVPLGMCLVRGFRSLRPMAPRVVSMGEGPKHLSPGQDSDMLQVELNTTKREQNAARLPT